MTRWYDRLCEAQDMRGVDPDPKGDYMTIPEWRAREILILAAERRGDFATAQKLRKAWEK